MFFCPRYLGAAQRTQIYGQLNIRIRCIDSFQMRCWRTAFISIWITYYNSTVL